MFTLLKELFGLLTPTQRRRFFTLQALVVLMSVAEIIGVAAIGPFMALVGDPEIVNTNMSLNHLYVLTGIHDKYDFIFWIGIAVIVILAAGSALSMMTIWRLSLFAVKTGTEIGDRLYHHFVNCDWLFHSSGSSAQLTKQISTETERVTSQILSPLMQMNAKLILAVFMSIAVFVYDPIVATVGLIIYGASYYLLYKLVRKTLTKNSRDISESATGRFKLMAEGFGGIKDVILLGRQSGFTKRFQCHGEKLAYAQGTNQALSKVPRYGMEFIAFGSVIMLVLYLIKSQEGIGTILPVISVYAFAGFKLLPAFQQLYRGLAQIRGNLSAFESIRDDLANSLSSDSRMDDLTVRHIQSAKGVDTKQSRLNREINLKNIGFTYPGKDQAAIKDLNLTIKANQIVGFVGASGSGKSTIIDLIAGLIKPQHGEVLVDGITLEEGGIRSWQDNIGFVPQNIFLSDASIIENIAFGLPQSAIDIERAESAIRLSHMDEFIDQLPDGVDTRVGERGVQLSGGQRQRIGVARALYHDAGVLILDEATSALDGITEKLIMDAIHDFSGNKTIIMIAHRLKTIHKCDKIFYLDNGILVDSGTYEELVERNPKFKRMSMHA